MAWVRDLIGIIVVVAVVAAAGLFAASKLVEAYPPSPPTLAEIDERRQRVEDAHDRLVGFQPGVLPVTREGWELLTEARQQRLDGVEWRYETWSDLVDEAATAAVDDVEPQVIYRDAFAEVLVIERRYLDGLRGCTGPVRPPDEVSPCAATVTAYAAGAFLEVLPAYAQAREALLAERQPLPVPWLPPG